ncbi:MAG: transporter [Rhodoglobus sp.]|nr:transporter [Rhodoglobus sp.]
MNLARTFFSRWWAVIAVLVLWQLIVTVFNVSQFLIPGPVVIGQEIARDPLTYVAPLLSTVRTAAIGFVLGVGLGYVASSVTWLLPGLGGVVTPLALVVRSVPFVALVPVLARVFGYSDQTAWIICTIVCFFPTFVLVSTGFADVPANGDDLFSMAGASRLDRYRLLAVPASLVMLATSIRISASTSIAGALVAEFLMGRPGLAYVLSVALGELDMKTLWAAALIAIVLSIVAYLLAGQFEKRVIARWR